MGQYLSNEDLSVYYILTHDAFLDEDVCLSPQNAFHNVYRHFPMFPSSVFIHTSLAVSTTLRRQCPLVSWLPTLLMLWCVAGETLTLGPGTQRTLLCFYVTSFPGRGQVECSLFMPAVLELPF